MNEDFVLGEAIVFQASASDSEIAIDELELSWTSDKDGDLGTGIINSSGEVTLTSSVLSENTHSIQFVVKDELESTCYDSVVISVHTKSAPDLIITKPTDGDVVSEHDIVQFEGSITDLEDLASDVTIVWTSDIDGAFSTQTANANGELALNVSSLSAGTHALSVIATDTSGLSDTELLLLTINQVPSQPIVALSPDPAASSVSLTAVASGSEDADGHNVTYTYNWLKNNTMTSNVGSSLSSFDTTKGEMWTVRATPNDGYHDGPYAEASISIGNTPPIISSLVLDTTQATSSQVIACTGSSSDQDGDSISEQYQWRNESTSVLLGSLAAQELSPLSVSPGDSISCTYLVDDGTDTVGQVVALTVVNTVPTIDALFLVPSSPYIGDTLTCMGTISDEDLEATSESYIWEN
jgi:hypothetical protein